MKDWKKLIEEGSRIWMEAKRNLEELESRLKDESEHKYPEGILQMRGSKEEGGYIYNVNKDGTVNPFSNCLKNVGEAIKKGYTIHSVKNSSGEILTVGDTTTIGVINRFKINKQNNIIVTSESDDSWWNLIDRVHPSAKKQETVYPKGIMEMTLIPRDTFKVFTGLFSNDYYNQWVAECIKEKYYISQVKNSTGEILSIGDKTQQGTIRSFQVQFDKITVFFSDREGQYNFIDDVYPIPLTPVEDYKKRLLEFMRFELFQKYEQCPIREVGEDAYNKRKLKWEGYFQALETVKNFK